jgi:hypothetical protein
VTTELSAAEQRYLTAACSASPLYAFCPRAVGRLAAFADRDTDVIVSTLSRAGMMDANDRHARLTERGRSAARAVSQPRPVRHAQTRIMLVLMGLSLTAVVAGVVAWVALA